MEHDINELFECIKNLRFANYNLKDANDILREENENLKQEIERLKKEIEDIQEDVEHNFKRISVGEQYDICDSDFI